MTDHEQFERRLRRVEDRARIHDLVARYAVAVDDRDHAAVARMYTAEGVFEHAGVRLRGREEIEGFLRERGGLNGKTVHSPHNVVIDWLTDDTARGIVTGHAEIERGGEFLVAALRYHDSYVREEGVWRFRERRTKFLYVTPVQELAEIFRTPFTKRWPGLPPQPGDL
ncbi:nuclear transport factor 2 family protein [Thermobifida halotolerans]|uniref:Nuclear transport factor 2 family protein n=1 Tax=Thermobifida halotolerans TaxID=483545 RepID=A0A399G6T1_9ACTN|nr:nuclear transport factor 2 family protein [Thermobifida halotolerans]UOE20891.1 nuclear transport factor 2 family protein [Thermobifida halotolerans]